MLVNIEDRNELRDGIEYLEYMIPKIKRKEVSYNEAKDTIQFFKDLYKKFYGRYPQGITEEIAGIYGKSA